jgi:hypothetical protein
MAVWAILAALATSFVHPLLVRLRNSDTWELALPTELPADSLEGADPSWQLDTQVISKLHIMLEWNWLGGSRQGCLVNWSQPPRWWIGAAMMQMESTSSRALRTLQPTLLCWTAVWFHAGLQDGQRPSERLQLDATMFLPPFQTTVMI